MAGPDNFSNPFESSSTRNPSAIGSGRSKNGSEGNNIARSDGHSPTSRSELQPNKAAGDPAAVLIRHLPAGTSLHTLRSMLLFSRDCDGCELVKTTPADEPFATAIARFKSSEGAQQARELLNGKPTDDGIEMKVEMINLTPGGTVKNQSLLDGFPANGIGHRLNSSRFGDTFRELDRNSHRGNDLGLVVGDSHNDGVSPTFGSARLPSHSPIGHGQRISGRSVIVEHDEDDEATRIVEDLVSFLPPEHLRLLNARRATAPTIPSDLAEHFGGLNIDSSVGHTNGLASPPSSTSGVTSPRGYGPPSLYPLNLNNGMNGMQHHQRGSISSAASPTSRFPPGIRNPPGYASRPNQHFPPVNPADQNPPCNTLYVGNLPLDTSEDELKALFSKQRGYKRLCFRTKQNGPMCFVEFEEIQWATRALSELYGTMLSNSVRGGIRLSFSKNPLGVRGPPQQSPVGSSHNGHGSPNMGFAGGPLGGSFGSVAGQGFSTASGPPPGLPAPQTFPNSRGSVSNGTFSSGRDSRNSAFGNYYTGR